MTSSVKTKHETVGYEKISRSVIVMFLNVAASLLVETMKPNTKKWIYASLVSIEYQIEAVPSQDLITTRFVHANGMATGLHDVNRLDIPHIPIKNDIHM